MIVVRDALRDSQPLAEALDEFPGAALAGAQREARLHAPVTAPLAPALTV